MSVVANSIPMRASQKSALLQLIDRYFYAFMALLIAVVVTYGFSNTINRNLIHAAVPPPRVLWVHAILFFGWLAFFILQTVLVRVHSLKLHRLLGWFGAAMGVALFTVGAMTTTAMTKFEIKQQLPPGDPAFMLVSFWDISCFAVCLALAICWRKRPAYHRRLALIATCVIASAGIGRFPAWIVPPNTQYAGVDVLILMGVAHDLLVDHTVHKVYRVVLPLLMAGQSLVMYAYLSRFPLWMKIATAIIQ